MKYLTIILLFGLFISTAYSKKDQNSQPARGLTTQTPSEEINCVGKELVTLRTSKAPSSTKSDILDNSHQNFGADEWESFAERNSRICIPAGDHYAVQLHLPARNINEYLPENSLNERCMEAVARAPRWIRNDLINNLNRIEGDFADFFQEFTADIILTVDEQYVDEVAFTVAHTSAQLLEDGNLDLNLFKENAETIYESDESLDYVRIVEHGDDDDFWTTLEYKIKDGDDTTDVEIDREMYYWHVVMPRLSDEMPLYINPATGRQSDPPSGVFWRDYLLNHPDEDYESLQDFLNGCGVLWAGLRNDVSEENGAIGAINRWVRHSLRFDSGQERPIQPVRVYSLHMGRCGEHSDLTAAAGRAALIPTICTSAFCDDHTWNEFWVGDRWVHWEPVNNMIDSPLSYENGWGKVFPVVVNWNSDSYLWGATERYSEDISDLLITVLDRDDKPIDGMMVRLASETLQGGTGWCGWGYTDHQGQVSFKIGNNRNIYVRAEGRLGRYPDGGVMQIIELEDNVGGQELEWSCNLWGGMPSVHPEEAVQPDEPTNHFRANVSYELIKETAPGSIEWRTNVAEYLVNVGSGKLDFFICDADNYRLYVGGEEFEAFNIEEITESGDIEMSLPTDGVWYAVFSNDNRKSNYVEVNIETTLYFDNEEVDVTEKYLTPVEYRLFQNHPNPFNSQTRFSYSIPEATDLSLKVYNSSGRLVSTLVNGNRDAGQYSVVWNANQFPAGIYFAKMETGGFSSTRKIVLMK